MIAKHANWPAPKNITALSTTRHGGYSTYPYHSNNLGLHVGDDALNVGKNRQQLTGLFNLPSQPVWLEQTHSTVCVIAEEEINRQADAAITRSAQHPLVVLTADCLPITLCDVQGTEIAAIHAGWRGLFLGIVENTLAKMNSNSSDILAWIGPAISQPYYEIGEEVYSSFTAKYPESSKSFQPHGDKWLANLPQIAEIVLHSQG
ncbi:MAG: peptidoglycan editing factor PgeF, partial [bacterium]|nr:peptidoglycan editing factor PgeF [bacterium]